MPQVVACGKCRQQFEAADFLAGTTVGCPACGNALAIPRPMVSLASPAAPMLRPASSGSQAGTYIDDLAKYLPPHLRRRDRAIGLHWLSATEPISTT